MVNIYKAFISPHLENCAPVLVGKSSAHFLVNWSLLIGTPFETLLNMSKSTSYSDLLTHVGLKTLEHRRYSHTVLTFVYFLFFTFIPLYNFYFMYLFHYTVIFFRFDMYWVYSNLARSRLNEYCTHPCNVDK